MKQGHLLNALSTQRLAVLNKHKSNIAPIRCSQDRLSLFTLHAERDSGPLVICELTMLADNLVEHQGSRGVLDLDTEDVVERDRPYSGVRERRKVL
jgi:hypothetical protein